MQRDWLQCGRRQLRKLPVGLDEAVEGLRAVLNNRQTALETGYILISGVGMDPRTKAAGNRFNRGELVIDFVTNLPDKPLPRIAFLLAQGDAYVREHQKRVRNAPLAKTGSSHHPVNWIAFTGKDHDALIGLIKQFRQLQLIGTPALGSLCAEMEDVLRRGIDQPQAMFGIKGKYRRVH